MLLTTKETRELSLNTVTAVILGKLLAMDYEDFDGYTAGDTNFKTFLVQVLGLKTGFPPHLRIVAVKFWAGKASRLLLWIQPQTHADPQSRSLLENWWSSTVMT
ncbi:hypothetical protein IL306_007446 [Fusarium sp. DS 682]|nr:hypothetical protein IL306_007446 [Fusarium sp. DS 682]